MPKLAIIGTIEIAPGRIDDYMKLAMAHRERCLRDEPGTLAFEILRPRDDDTKVMLYEVYEDDAAFEAHWNGASIKQIRQKAGDIIVKVSGVRCSLA
jgi:quinol monooxygenase YgiN